MYKIPEHEEYWSRHIVGYMYTMYSVSGLFAGAVIAFVFVALQDYHF